MKPIGYVLSGALVAMAMALGTPDVWAQARGHSGGGGGSRPSGGSSGGSSHAVPRGSSGGSASGSGSGGVHSSGGSRATGAGSSRGDGGIAVDRGGSRSNRGNPIVGSATERTRPYYRPGGRGYYPYDPYYLYGYGAFGLGAFYYDPFWWGSPYGYYGGYGYPGYGGGYYDRQELEDGVKGGIKLKVTPDDAEVLVDGYYVGRVDEFNGVFQRLNILAGPHRIEIRAPGYETLALDVRVEPRETISYHGGLQPLGAK